jgi:Na+/proline symporter
MRIAVFTMRLRCVNDACSEPSLALTALIQRAVAPLAATVKALTGMNIYAASFLIPIGVIFYTASGGLKATFLASYIHTAVIFVVLVIFVVTVYVKNYSSDIIYDKLKQVIAYEREECEAIFMDANGTTFYDNTLYTCGQVPGNREGSYLTMVSGGGLMFGVINIIGNFGTVFVDQSYWQVRSQPPAGHPRAAFLAPCFVAPRAGKAAGGT